MNNFDTFTKIAYEWGRWGQIKKLPKVQNIAQSGHTYSSGMERTQHIHVNKKVIKDSLRQVATGFGVSFCINTLAREHSP